jgi:hypothetical protein
MTLLLEEGLMYRTDISRNKHMVERLCQKFNFFHTFSTSVIFGEKNAYIRILMSIDTNNEDPTGWL